MPNSVENEPSTSEQAPAEAGPAADRSAKSKSPPPARFRFFPIVPESGINVWVNTRDVKKSEITRFSKAFREVWGQIPSEASDFLAQFWVKSRVPATRLNYPEITLVPWIECQWESAANCTSDRISFAVTQYRTNPHLYYEVAYQLAAAYRNTTGETNRTWAMLRVEYQADAEKTGCSSRDCYRYVQRIDRFFVRALARSWGFVMP